jgi:AcrR family transcriptional regulator
VQATREILEAGGYGAASVQAIADRAGFAAGALYRHFPSKAELVVEVFREAAKRDLVAMREAGSSGSCLERLEAAVATFAGRALANRRLAWALVYEPVDPLVDAERLVFRREYCRQMAGLLRQGIAAGEIPAQDADLSAGGTGWGHRRGNGRSAISGRRPPRGAKRRHRAARALLPPQRWRPRPPCPAPRRPSATRMSGGVFTPRSA